MRHDWKWGPPTSPQVDHHFQLHTFAELRQKIHGRRKPLHAFQITQLTASMSTLQHLRKSSQVSLLHEYQLSFLWNVLCGLDWAHARILAWRQSLKESQMSFWK